MKIIHRGEVIEKTYQSNCRKCGSVLEFTRKDGVLVDDRNETLLKVSCPVCQNEIWVKQ